VEMIRKVPRPVGLPWPPSSLSVFDWMDPKVTRITSCFVCFVNETSVSEFLGRVPILKSDASHDIMIVEPCELTNTM